MKGPFQILNPLTYPRWNDLVTASVEYSFFLSSNWARLLYETYNFQPVYFSRVEDDRFRTLLPVMDVKSYLTGPRGVSLPFTDFCEPVLEPGDDVGAEFSHLIDYGRKARWNYIELRGGKYFSGHTPSISSYYLHTLPLLDEDKIIAGFHDHNWKNIKTAGKKGLVAEVSTSLESVEYFYDLHCMTRKWHGVPPQSITFFRKIHEFIIGKGLGFVVLAKHEGKYIAGGVFFHFGNQTVYKYGASDHRYRSLCGNNLVIWEAIRRYAAQGYKTMSFGRTDLTAEGLRQFKKAWGTEETIINYYKYDLRKNRFVDSLPARKDALKSILQRMPTPLLRFAGSLFYRHAG